MSEHRLSPDEICSQPATLKRPVGQPLAPAIYPAAVYQCEDPAHADRLLSGAETGYVYQRDGHPNADMLADKIERLHEAQWALVTSCGMGGLAAIALAELSPGDHVVATEDLYGRSLRLLAQSLPRWGISTSIATSSEIDAIQAVMRPTTKLIVVETLSNPMLRVADIESIGELAHQNQSLLVVDNTFATPYLCQPLTLGADLVIESVSKMINGHSDIMLGLIAGRGPDRARYVDTMSTWGLASSPFDCWLALRGLSTLPLRMERAMANAQAIAKALDDHPAVLRVDYPGLRSHPHHTRASQLFRQRGFGVIVTFEIRGDAAVATQFLKASQDILFFPSLGDVSTTLSHPASTSHRSFSVDQRRRLGIADGTMRLSVGIESAPWIIESLQRTLDCIA